MNLPFLKTIPPTSIRRYAGTLTTVVALAGSVFLRPSAGADDAPTFDWIPPDAYKAGIHEDFVAGALREVVITPTPKRTADASKFTNEYLIELQRFGIHNDGTHPAETSKGINEALQHAKSLNANRIVFPKGTYLIHEEAPILLDHQNTIIDLNGATLQIKPNGLPNYAVVEIIYGAEHLRLTNGTIRGDRHDHDYASQPGTHEWGACLRVTSGKHLEIDNLKLTEGTGDGIATANQGHRTREELLARILHSVQRKHLEPGGFSPQAGKTPGGDKIRTIEPFEIPDGWDQFELGYMGGYMGFPWIKGRDYQIYFLDENKGFLEKQEALQYRKVRVPKGTRYAHFEFNQPAIDEVAAHSSAGDGWMVRITNFTPGTDVHFHNNVLQGNRRLGMAYSGGQRWIIENNHFAANGGTAPAYGVDFEDGWEMMHDVVFRKNTFKDNQAGDLVVCAGSELLVEDNDFERSVHFHGRPHNYTVRNNRFNGSVTYRTRTGIATIQDNLYKGSRVSIVFDNKGVADGLVRAPGQTVATPPLLLSKETFVDGCTLNGTYLYLRDSKFNEANLIAGTDTRMIRLEKCVFENSSLEFKREGPEVHLILEDNQGELPITGPDEGQQRIIKPAR